MTEILPIPKTEPLASEITVVVAVSVRVPGDAAKVFHRTVDAAALKLNDATAGALLVRAYKDTSFLATSYLEARQQ